MTVVVADTSPVNDLILIREIEILHHLYGTVLLPPEVLAELTDRHAPVAVLDWIRSRPAWLKIRASAQHRPDPSLERLDPGPSAYCGRLRFATSWTFPLPWPD